jgi:hypothetical protein
MLMYTSRAKLLAVGSQLLAEPPIAVRSSSGLQYRRAPNGSFMCPLFKSLHMRTTRDQEFAHGHRGEAERLDKPATAASHQGAQNTVGEFCASWHVAGRPSRGGPGGVGAARLAAPTVPQRISPHQKRVLPHPRGETQTVSPHPRATTDEPQTTCARHVGRNSPGFAPREKEKNFRGAKPKCFKPLGAFRCL